jgi:hypothetical protein
MERARVGQGRRGVRGVLQGQGHEQVRARAPADARHYPGERRVDRGSQSRGIPEVFTC